MTIKARDFDRLISKLGFVTRDARDLLAWLEHDGKKVLWTKRSHMKGEDLPFQHQIRQQLKLNESQLREALRCTLGVEQYLEILRGRGYL